MAFLLGAGYSMDASRKTDFNYFLFFLKQGIWIFVPTNLINTYSAPILYIQN